MQRYFAYALLQLGLSSSEVCSPVAPHKFQSQGNSYLYSYLKIIFQEVLLEMDFQDDISPLPLTIHPMACLTIYLTMNNSHTHYICYPPTHISSLPTHYPHATTFNTIETCTISTSESTTNPHHHHLN